MATFLANEINATDRDVNRAQRRKSKLSFLERIKILIANARYLKPFFSGTSMNKQSKKVELGVI